MNRTKTFFDMPLTDGMKETISAVGFNSPTPIQERTIPEILLGKDLLGQAQTGTGKTAAFAIPLVELVDDRDTNVQALVVCPTRELCLQVCQEVKRLSNHKPRLKTVAVYGGQSIEQQFRALKSDLPQILVATPGRLFDHLRRKSVSLSTVRLVVLDEADEMLDMGFRPEIEEIFGLLPEGNQRIFFSATMPKAIKDLACSYLREPNIVKTESSTLTVSTIEQSYLRARGKDKTEILCRILDHRDPKLAVVFCNAKKVADEIGDELVLRGYDAGVLHGDLSQNQRDRVMAKFKTGSIRVLIATDVAARGLDISDVELVLNYHLPHDPEDYVHRIGRTGRAGRSGFAVSLVEPRDNSRLRRISQFAKIEIREENPPSLAEIRKSKVESFFKSVTQALSSERIKEYRSIVSKQKLTAEDIAAATLQMAMSKFDEKSVSDEIFAEVREREYSGLAAESRFRRRDSYDGDRPDRKRNRRSFGERPTGGRSSNFRRDYSGKRPPMDEKSETPRRERPKPEGTKKRWERGEGRDTRKTFAREEVRADKNRRTPGDREKVGFRTKGRSERDAKSERAPKDRTRTSGKRPGRTGK